MIVSFAAWERQFSIFRYLSFVELLSFTPVAVLALDIARGETSRRFTLAASLIALGVLHATTVTPNWGRLPHAGGTPLPVHVPALASDSLVLILDPSPLAYIAAFEPDTIRFFGANNNLTRPAEGGPLQARIRAAIAAQGDHLYGLEAVGYGGGMAGDTLGSYGLHRTLCEPVWGAIVGGDIELCTLGR